MPFIAIIIGALIVIAAYNDAQWTLGSMLRQDIPAYFKWAAAIVVILGAGFLPGMKTPSRWLIALVALVIVMKNWKVMVDDLKSFAAGEIPTGSGAAEPTSAYVQSGGAGGTPTQAQVAGVANAGATATANAPVTPAAALAANFMNPDAVLTGFTASVGFGGQAG